MGINLYSQATENNCSHLQKHLDNKSFEKFDNKFTWSLSQNFSSFQFHFINFLRKKKIPNVYSNPLPTLLKKGFHNDMLKTSSFWGSYVVVDKSEWENHFIVLSQFSCEIILRKKSSKLLIVVLCYRLRFKALDSDIEMRKWPNGSSG